jgi:hypothetical protein
MQRRRTSQPLEDQVTLAAMVAIVAAPLFVLTAAVPRPLILPVVCLIAVAGALFVSLIAWRRGIAWNSHRVTAWDVAGAFAFIACAAAIMGDPNDVAALTSAATTVADLTSAQSPHP